MSADFAELALIDISRLQRLRLEVHNLIEQCIAVYDNECALAEKRAVSAFIDERPSYWTSAGNSSQRASQLQREANTTSLEKALRSSFKGGDYIAALDTLIPLNSQAVIALIAQYSEYGTWMEMSELEMRREKRMGRTRVLS